MKGERKRYERSMGGREKVRKRDGGMKREEKKT